MGLTDEEFPYNDIIDLPHHVSKRRPQMSIKERAAQFAPFSALNGYEAAIRETARLTDEQIEIDEDRMKELDRKLRIVANLRTDGQEVVITYYQPDNKKDGGAYITAVGQINKIDDFERVLSMKDGRKIPMDHITEVESDLLLSSMD